MYCMSCTSSKNSDKPALSVFAGGSVDSQRSKVCSSKHRRLCDQSDCAHAHWSLDWSESRAALVSLSTLFECCDSVITRCDYTLIFTLMSQGKLKWIDHKKGHWVSSSEKVSLEYSVGTQSWNNVDSTSWRWIHVFFFQHCVSAGYAIKMRNFQSSSASCAAWPAPLLSQISDGLKFPFMILTFLGVGSSFAVTLF